MKRNILLLVCLFVTNSLWAQTYSLAPSSGQNGFRVFDTRNTNDLPQARNMGFYGDFKLNSTDSLKDGGAYNGVLTFRQYGINTDFTGGLSHQLGFTDRNNLWIRSGKDTTWGTWCKIWTSGNDGSGSGLDADLIRGQSPQWATNGSVIYSTNSSNVLIGKTSQTNSSYKLDVNGNIRANQVTVNATGADYVFDSSYQLSPLSLLATYIKIHHHLPDIPPAGEIQRKGLDLGEMEDKQLQKIEELTLYQITAGKRMDELEKRNLQLEQEMNGYKQELHMMEKEIGQLKDKLK